MNEKKTCPVCGKPVVKKYAPFCSKRCAEVDLARWLGGVYRIPTDEPPDGGYVEPDETSED